MVNIDSIISLEEMKEIMKKSIENAETWEDFYTGIIIGVYELGLERGKITSSSKFGKWIDDGDPLTWICSECGYRVARYNNTPYCPNCKVNMRS